MKVYLLLEKCEYEGYYILAAYASEADAKVALFFKNEEHYFSPRCAYRVREMEVLAPRPSSS